MIRAPDLRLYACLEMWAEWMQNADTRLGYPKRSALMSCGGSHSADAFEHLCEAADARTAVIMDSIIDSLPIVQQAAVQHFWLGAVWRGRDLEGAYALALDQIQAMATLRGVL